MNKQITNPLTAKKINKAIIYLSKIKIKWTNNTIPRKLGDKICLLYSKKQDNIQM